MSELIPGRFQVLVFAGTMLILNLGGTMRRREFVSFLAGAAAWPIASKAQPAERTRVVGVLDILGTDDPETKILEARSLRKPFSSWDGPLAAILRLKLGTFGGDLDHLPPLRGGIDRAHARRNRKHR